MTISELDLMRGSARFWQGECGRLEEEIIHLKKEIIEGDKWGRFAGYLLDNCEGETIYEENLQYWLSEMLRKEGLK